MHFSCLPWVLQAPTHITVHSLITLIIFGEEYDLHTSSFHFLESPVLYPFRLDPNILLTPCSQIYPMYVFPSM
jgi:hypothetical protein